MSPEDRKAFSGIIVGVAWGGLTMAGPLAFPTASPWIWQASFALSAIIVIAGAFILAYDFFIRPRLKGGRLDPFLVVAALSAFVCFGALATFIARHAASGEQPANSVASGQPKLALIIPNERHEIRWAPTESNEIQIGPEGKISEGNWFVPSFDLKTVTAIPAQDVSVRWQMDMLGIEKIVKGSSNLEGYKFEFGVNKVTLSGSPKGLGWQYNFASSEVVSLPFITPVGVKAVIPLTVFTNLMLYTVAAMPSQPGAKIDPFPFTVTVSWNLPQPGFEKFSVIANISNAKGPGVSNPKVDALVSFQVRKL